MEEKKKITTREDKTKPQAKESLFVKKHDKPLKNEKPKGTIPIVLKTKKEKLAVEKNQEPVGIFEIERTMRDLGPKLKDPKTKEAAEKELKALHDRMRKFKKNPGW